LLLVADGVAVAVAEILTVVNKKRKSIVVETAYCSVTAKTLLSNF
jgi:hypothetical protein